MMMKVLKFLVALCGTVLLLADCALPLGEDYTLTRAGNSKESGIIYITDYDLQHYVPIPDTGKTPVVSIENREDLSVTVEWKQAGIDVPQPFEAFLPGTFYTAKIRFSAKPGYGFRSSTPFAYHPGKTQTQTNDLGNPVRTVMVSYNSSDEANITYITNYNLQTYVPVPLAGEHPVWRIDTQEDMTVKVTWKGETSPGSGIFTPLNPVDTSSIFNLSVVYQAEISLETNEGYRFFADRNFAYADGTVVSPNGSETDPEQRSFTVTYGVTRAPTVIDDFNLTPYITKPISGTTAVVSFAGPQYTGTAIWKDSDTQAVLTGPFLPVTAYTAELTLIPVPGYTLTGVGADAFNHTGAESISNPAGSGAISVSFSPTGTLGSPTVVYDLDLTNCIPMPVSGVTPVIGITGAQYAGAVTWKPYDSTFRNNTVYKAVLTLNAAAGYTFTGVAQNAFTHNGASVVSNLANSGTVTISFPATASDTYRYITSLGPVENKKSALYLMRERCADTFPLFIDLPDNEIETVDADSVILLAGQTSPATVTINGHQRVLKISDKGTLLKVGGGVTMTLQNITLEGITHNNAPLIEVQPGGKLILGAGVTLTGNHSSGDIGGVKVIGGELVLNDGAAIQDMRADLPGSGGGVLIDGRGKFTMNGGIVGSENSLGNKVSGLNSGSGVYVDAGTFIMNGGLIKGNTAGLESGAVYVVHEIEIYFPELKVFNGRFIMYDGTITGNTNSSGVNYGVYVFNPHIPNDAFSMSGSAQVMTDNKVFVNTSICIHSDLTSTVAADLVRPSSTLPILNPPLREYYLINAQNESLLARNVEKFLYKGDNIFNYIATNYVSWWNGDYYAYFKTQP
jgi:hypothetical protein